MKNPKVKLPLFIATSKTVELNRLVVYVPVVRIITDTGPVNFLPATNEVEVFDSEDKAAGAARRVTAAAEKELRRFLAREGYRDD